MKPSKKFGIVKEGLEFYENWNLPKILDNPPESNIRKIFFEGDFFGKLVWLKVIRVFYFIWMREDKIAILVGFESALRHLGDRRG